MAAFSLEEICNATDGVCAEKSKQFLGVSIDSRTVQKGDLFIALSGEHFDGHDYLAEVQAKGAAGAIVMKGCSLDGFTCIEVDSPLHALQRIANFHRLRYDIPIVAITGSSGKTTTKELVAAVLASKYNVLKTEKNFNNEIGLPLTLLKLNDSHEVCVVEMGMRGLGQIKELAEIAEPTVGIITNVGTSHLELLGSQEHIAAAKGELIEALGSEGTAILNEDDFRVAGMAKLSKGKVIGYGIDHHVTVTASNIAYKKDGLKFTCKCYDEIFDVVLPMIGTHNVYNSLAAIAVGRVLGISSAKIKKALQGFEGIAMRQEIKVFENFVLVNDSYNANPSSMKESLHSLGQLEGRRKIAILGDMLELGASSEEMHYEIGIFLGEEKYDILIFYGKEAKNIGRGAVDARVPLVKETFSHEEIARYYLSVAEEDDVVLLKGSRGMTMEKVVEEINKIKGSN